MYILYICFLKSNELEASRSSKIAKSLLEINAIKLNPKNPFTWASGIQSPIYCDNRVTLSHPEIRTYIAESFAELCADYEYDAVVGVATAGIPHGMLLAQILGVPFAYVRSKSKAHGRQNQLEGDLPLGSRVIVIEDLISTGGSSLAAVDALKTCGVETVIVLAIFQYGFPFALEAFNKKDTGFATLTDYGVLLDVASELEYISSSEIQTLKDWRIDPHNWTQ